MKGTPSTQTLLTRHGSASACFLHQRRSWKFTDQKYIEIPIRPYNFCNTSLRKRRDDFSSKRTIISIKIKHKLQRRCKYILGIQKGLSSSFPTLEFLVLQLVLRENKLILAKVIKVFCEFSKIFQAKLNKNECRYL